MNQLNFCLICSYRCKLPRPLPKSLIAIQKKGQNIAPWIHQLVNQKWDLK